MKEPGPRKTSLDALRPSNRQGSLTPEDARALDSPGSFPFPASDSPTAAKMVATPKTPATPSSGDHLAPSWRSTSFNASRNGRTSFSQDRDRAPVASPISPPLPSGRGVGQTMKRLGIKGKKSKGSKGIGPADVIILNFDNQEDGGEVITDAGSRPSMSAESRPSFGGGARPSFSSMLRSPFANGRPSFEVMGRHALASAETATKAPSQGDSNGLIPSPVAPSFGSLDPTRQVSTKLSNITDGDGKTDGSQVAGLGIGSVQWSEAMPSHKSEGVDIPGSASDGTFTTRGVQTPENGSLSHSYSSQLPARSDSTGATSPVGERVSMDTVPPPAGPVKSAELLALEDMLGRFPQQQKVLLQDISARVAQTPLVGAGGSTSKEDVTSSSGVFLSFVES